MSCGGRIKEIDGNKLNESFNLTKNTREYIMGAISNTQDSDRGNDDLVLPTQNINMDSSSHQRNKSKLGAHLELTQNCNSL